MTLTLRPYQSEAIAAIMTWCRRSVEPACIEAATGAGKSILVAEVARQLRQISGKRVLCLAPSAELVKQNHAKFEAISGPASVFSASAGRKCTNHDVVFGTPGTVKNAAGRFANDYAAVIVDECHGITPTLRAIITAMREGNPLLREIGMTATPYRMGTGYIFESWPDASPVADWQTREPYYRRLLYRIQAPELIEAGYLTRPVSGDVGAQEYAAHTLKLNARGQFDAGEVARVYEGQRLTGDIVRDIVRLSVARRSVLIFAATVQHAQEVMMALPQDQSAIVTGETPRRERADILRQFVGGSIKYLVNVAVLTTGFDAPHVDVVALLRATESVGLLQQIIGRGLRLSPGKQDVMVLDYAGNIPRHCPDGDIFAPEVTVGRPPESGVLECECPTCGATNTFAARHLDKGMSVDQYGYLLDLSGARVETDDGPMPAHFGRRCNAFIGARNGVSERCGYRWTAKRCKACGADNDIAARRCGACRAELVDPNATLARQWSDVGKPTRSETSERVLSMVWRETVSARKNAIVVVDWVTEGGSFRQFLQKDLTRFPWARAALRRWMKATNCGEVTPAAITYRQTKSGYYEVTKYESEGLQGGDPLRGERGGRDADVLQLGAAGTPASGGGRDPHPEREQADARAGGAR